MPVTVIATPGASNANSFLTRTRADELALEHPYSSAWTGLTDTNKKDAALIRFSKIVSAECWRGKRAIAGQRLSFPRLGLKYDDDNEVDSSTIPPEIEEAVFIGVLGLLQKDTSLPPSQLVEGLTKLKADVVELGFKDLRYKSMPDHVKSMIPSSWFCPEIVSQKAVLKVFG